ncbi:DUF6482 family protein [Cobetia sp. 10Alg 146]|uniref:DUF6482 family protein n=1 Tax=Cobetia sp. 10Alg 146 TaxID=3040019 RepID=UPI00244D57E4|nr:DUF6482 family protein [Cobetia sp. 10Alg 146]MDH2290790.1 DUF6482 family protein [Cobetia sp. 10Alg 146]
MQMTPPLLGEGVSVETLRRWLAEGNTLTVEIQTLDQGLYLVRLHHADGISRLVDEDGQSLRFTGTQWISRLLLPLGLTHGVQTWAEVQDEMIGLPTTPVDNAGLLAHGTRVAFKTL